MTGDLQTGHLSSLRRHSIRHLLQKVWLQLVETGLNRVSRQTGQMLLYSCSSSLIVGCMIGSYISTSSISLLGIAWIYCGGSAVISSKICGWAIVYLGSSFSAFIYSFSSSAFI